MKLSIDKMLAGNTAPVVLLFTHAILLGWAATRHNPVMDEVAHLPSGLSHLLFERFDLYKVNPPLVRMVAALPLLGARPETNWHHYSSGPRAEFQVGADFLQVNGDQSQWYFVLGRWACIPFSLLGAYTCWRWAHDLYGSVAAFLALALWSFCPNVLAHAQMVTPDTGASALGVCAAYSFWRWLRSPNCQRAMLAGLGMGLALLSKTTWLIAFIVWPILFFMFHVNQPSIHAHSSWRSHIKQLTIIMLIAILVLNAGYGFEGFGEPLGTFQFHCQALRGTLTDSLSAPSDSVNRFHGTWLGRIPLPLPESYVLGIDLQKCDFDKNMPAYLHGEWRSGGWWYYYVYGLAIKVPLGTWLLLFGAAFLGSVPQGCKRDEYVLLAPAVVILVLVSSQTGINRHLRYILPAFPFAFVWCGRVASRWATSSLPTKLFVGASLLWSAGSSLMVYPHSLSYFNELVGGPVGGHAHLVDSNIDWGQDLLYLKTWVQEHPEAQPLHLSYFGAVQPGFYGIDYEPVFASGRGYADGEFPKPGWYAISVNHLRALSGRYRDFLRLRPIAMAGYSIYIFHISEDDWKRLLESKAT